MTGSERETYYNTCSDTKAMHVSTFEPRVIERFEGLAGKYPNDVRLVVKREGYAEFEFPKSWLKVKPPRILTDEQRNALKERGRALYARQLAKKAGASATDGND